MKGTCKSLIQDLRFNGQCVCVGGGGGGGVYVPLKALFLVFFFFFFSFDSRVSDQLSGHPCFILSIFGHMIMRVLFQIGNLWLGLCVPCFILAIYGHVMMSILFQIGYLWSCDH